MKHTFIPRAIGDAWLDVSRVERVEDYHFSIGKCWRDTPAGREDTESRDDESYEITTIWLVAIIHTNGWQTHALIAMWICWLIVNGYKKKRIVDNDMSTSFIPN